MAVGEAAISIHASPKGSDQRLRRRPSRREISIHASPKGSDRLACMSRLIRTNFNPRFPEGKRPWRLSLIASLGLFQSTLPRREATPPPSFGVDGFDWISIHASPKGSDGMPRTKSTAALFQSTLPRREATRFFQRWQPGFEISIHASPKGSDPLTVAMAVSSDVFQSTLPRREATPPRFPYRNARRYFNPRFPEGKRPPVI